MCCHYTITKLNKTIDVASNLPIPDMNRQDKMFPIDQFL